MNRCPRCGAAAAAEPLLCAAHAGEYTPLERFKLYRSLEGKRRTFKGYQFTDMPHLPCPFPGCGSIRRVCLADKQLRSGDEGSSMFYLCDRGHQLKDR
jgi:hypothetical protein